jgi:hypothetical protein
MTKFLVLAQRNHYAFFTVEAEDAEHAMLYAEDKMASKDESVEWQEEDGDDFGYRFIRIVDPYKDE